MGSKSNLFGVLETKAVAERLSQAATIAFLTAKAIALVAQSGMTVSSEAGSVEKLHFAVGYLLAQVAASTVI